MFGREAAQPGVLVEPQVGFDPTDESALIDFRTKIWYVSSYLPPLAVAYFR